MKKCIKALSAALALLMLATAAVSVSAGSPAIADDDPTEVSGEVFKGSKLIPEKKAASANKISASSKVIPANKLVPAKSIVKTEKPAAPAKPFIRTAPKYTCLGCTPGCSDYETAVKDFFDKNSFGFSIYKDDAKFFCSDVYYVSEDNDIVYYDCRTGMLTGKDYGSTHVYVYTSNGTPFLRLDITVINKPTGFREFKEVQLIPEKWQLENTKDTTGFDILCGKACPAEDYNVFVFDGSAKIVDGKLKAWDDGPVIVRAESKRRPHIYTDTLVYVGDISTFAYDYSCDLCRKSVRPAYDCYYDYDCRTIIDYDPDLDAFYPVTEYNYYNRYPFKFSEACKWIKALDDTYIPVLTAESITVENNDGTTRETIGIGYRDISGLDYIRSVYGSKADLAAAIREYNRKK